MSARVIALAKAQALGLREAAAACGPTQAPLKVRLLSTADSLHGLATLAEDVRREVDNVATTLTKCAADLRASGIASNLEVQ